MKAEDVYKVAYVDNLILKDSESCLTNLQFTVKCMKEYAKQKCKEQREICYNSSKIDRIKFKNPIEDTLYINKKSILNAPEPNFD